MVSNIIMRSLVFLSKKDAGVMYTTVPAYVEGYVFHLSTDNIYATRYPGAKMAWSRNDSKLHMVYESNHKIYYTSSEDTGRTWSKEYLISSFSDSVESSFPNIVTNDVDDIVCMWQVSDRVLWRIKRSGDEDWEKIRFFINPSRGFILKNGNQQNIYSFILFPVTHSSKATVDTFQVVIFRLEDDVWRVVDTIPGLKVTGSDTRWADFDYDAMLSNGDSTIAVAFIHEDTLYYARGDLMADGVWQWNVEQIGSGYMFPLSITQYNGHFHVFTSKNRKIWDVDLDNPVVQLQVSSDNTSSMAPVAPDSNIVFWMGGDTSHKIYFSYREGSTWSDEIVISQDYDNAAYPNAFRIPSSPLCVYVYTGGDSVPYNIGVGVLNEDYLVKNIQASLQENNSVQLEWSCNVAPYAEFEIQRKKLVADG